MDVHLEDSLVDILVDKEQLYHTVGTSLASRNHFHQRLQNTSFHCLHSVLHKIEDKVIRHRLAYSNLACHDLQDISVPPRRNMLDRNFRKGCYSHKECRNQVEHILR